LLSAPPVILRARWLAELNGVAVEISAKKFAGAAGGPPRKSEIKFSLTGESDIQMALEGESYVVPETLSEWLIKKVLNHKSANRWNT
jgi:hypothetical protein